MASKQEIEAFLEEIEVSDLVKNLQIMGDNAIIDMVSHSPAMHEKVKLEKAMKAAFETQFPSLQLKLNIKVEVPETTEIKGKGIPGIQNIVAIASGKGGVGKSTVSANMAISLAKMGFKVGLLDADIYGPSQPTMFDVEKEKPLSVEVNGKNKMKPVESHGIKILSIGFFSNMNQAVVWRGPMASKAIHQMLHDADWGELDFLLIDLPPGTGDIHLSIVQEIPLTGAVIVSTPQNIATVDARKGIAMFQMESINVPVLGMVENMAYFSPPELPENKYYIFGKDGVKMMAEQLNTPFLGEVPIVQSIREAADVGNPIALNSDSKIAENYTQITQNMITELVQRNTHLPPTEVVKITTMAGCSPSKN